MSAADQRRRRSYELRVQAASYYKGLPLPDHLTNGDDHRYAGHNHFASFTKGLPHDNVLGEVVPDAYRALRHALHTGEPEDFAAIPQGCNGAGKKSRRFVDPQAGLAFDLEGIDSHQLFLPPPYQFSDAGEIGEIAENYWMALCRDVPFADYGAGAGSVTQAAADLSKYLVFDGPKAGGKVTKDTLFRGFTAGDLIGPYLSQFLLLDVPYGAERFEQRIAFALPENKDYMIDPVEWLAVQKGCDPGIGPTPVPEPKYIYRGRDLAQYVHIDELFQAYLNACLILIGPNGRGGLDAPLNPGNPYPGSNQEGFGTLGEPNFKVMVAEVATRALKAIWFQKWFVHRRLRPETFAGRLHHQKAGTAGADKYPFHAGELAKLSAVVLPQVQAHNVGLNSYLLPMAFPEGSPVHPAYGAGHATVAGACITVLKALFKDDEPITPLIEKAKRPDGTFWKVKVPKNDGTDLTNYAGDTSGMTVGGELDKLAANVGIARNFAGVHWRSDYTESMKLGEQVAIHFLRDTAMTYNEDVYFEFTRFDGSRITITKTG